MNIAKIFVAMVVLLAAPALALDRVDWSETMLPPTPIAGVETGQVISFGPWLIVAGETFQVCDTSDPAAPIVIGAVDLPEPATRLRIHDGLVFVVCGASGLLAADLSAPTAPAVRVVFATPGTVADVGILGDVAVVVTAEGTLLTLSDYLGDEPVVSASVDTGNTIYCTEIVGEVALVGTLGGFLPVDLTDPSAPVPGETIRPSFGGVWHYYLPVTDMVVDGATLYAALHYYYYGYDSYSMRRVVEIDVSDPLNPELVAWEYGTDGRLVAFGEHLAIVGRQKLDVVEVDGFGLSARFPLHEDPVAIALHGATDLYIAGEEQIFHADVATPRCIEPHAIAPDGGRVVHGGRYRYIGTFNSYDDGSIDPLVVHSYWIYDMAGAPDLLMHDVMMCYDCSLPVARNVGVSEQFVVQGYDYYYTQWLNCYDRIRDRTIRLDRTVLAVAGDYLWAGYKYGPEVFVYDIGGPYNPVEIGRFDAPDRDLTQNAVHDGNLMICYSSEQLWAVAIGDNAPVTLSLVDRAVASWVGQIELDDRRLIFIGNHELRIWDYTTATAPVHLGALPCGFEPRQFAADGHLLVVADDDQFQIFQGPPGELPHPVSPVLDYPHDSLTLADGQLYVADDEGNLILFDVSDPAAPTIVGTAHGPSAEMPFVDGDRIYAGYSVFPRHSGDFTPIGDAGDNTDDTVPALPTAITLHAPVPNPFNPATSVTFDLARRTHATLTVHDLRGRTLTTLADAPFAAGSHTLTWRGTDAQGRALPSGTYLVRLVTESAVRTTKAVLIR